MQITLLFSIFTIKMIIREEHGKKYLKKQQSKPLDVPVKVVKWLLNGCYEFKCVPLQRYVKMRTLQSSRM